MPLNPQQQKAVQYLNGPLLVLAGPGTGKTQLLSEKVAHILQVTDANADSILCLTFTDAGAMNMRERLRSMIGPTANSINIHTYHSFGAYLLNRYKNYTFKPIRNLDTPIDNVTQFKILQKIIESLPPNDISKDTKIDLLIELLSTVKSAGLNSSDLKLIAETNILDSKEISKEISPILNNIPPRIKFDLGVDFYRQAGTILASYTSSEPIVKNIPREANELILELNHIIDQESAKEKPSISPLTKWRRDYFEKTTNNDYRLKDFVTNHKLLSLSHILQFYEQKLKENNLFDFADMIQESINILKSDDGFRYTMQERFQYVLLDEFQDTNPSQFELITLIADPKKQPDIMAVGDDDQAIFAFQGANASNLIDFQNTYNAEYLVLTENYRSTTEILDLSRKIADQIDSSFAKHRNINKILTSVRNSEILSDVKSGTSQIVRHEFKSSDAEYSWVASEVNRLIQSGEKPSEIAIITPKHKFVTPLLPYLRAYKDINVSYEKRENIFEDERIHELITLARFIYEISQEKNPSHRLIEILTYPFFQLPTTEVITALQSDHHSPKNAFEYLSSSNNHNLKKITDFFSFLVAKSFNTPLELFLDYLIGSVKIEELNYTSPFLDYYAKDKLNFKSYELYDHLSVLKEHLKSYLKIDKPRLKDFITFLDDYDSAGQAIINTSPYQDSTDSVQIVTAHKSKGLEYRHVFLISVDDLAWGNSKGNNDKFALPINLRSVRHTGDTDDECLRLFFVAITRAKKSLTLTNSIQNYSGKATNRLAYLGEYAVNDSEIASPYLPNTNIVEHYEDIPDEQRLSNVKKYWLSSILEDKNNIQSFLEKHIKNYRMTATKLSSFIDITYGGPLSVFENLLNLPVEPSNLNVIFGTLIHTIFEKTTNQNLSIEEALKLFESEINQLDQTDQAKAEIIERGRISIEHSLTTFSHILKPTKESSLIPKAEINFASENLFFENIPITGKIDHININEQEKTIEVYDFKTGAFKDKKWDSDSTLYKYALQLGFYKLLLNTSPTFSKYKVTRGHILFVSPKNKDLIQEKDQLVYDKVYDFNLKDEEFLKTLLRSVYTHIKSLDFIDKDSPLNILPDPNKKLKDIKDFCQLVIDTVK